MHVTLPGLGGADLDCITSGRWLMSFVLLCSRSAAVLPHPTRAGFIPGSYVSFIIYQTWKGVPGYSYDQIPSYDD